MVSALHKLIGDTPEKAIKINEKLTERGKCRNTVERTEFKDIAESVGLKEQPPPPDPENN